MADDRRKRFDLEKRRHRILEHRKTLLGGNDAPDAPKDVTKDTLDETGFSIEDPTDENIPKPEGFQTASEAMKDAMENVVPDGANLKGADLSNVPNAKGADLKEVTAADFAKAMKTPVENANLKGADLSTVDFSGVTLEDAVPFREGDGRSKKMPKGKPFDFAAELKKQAVKKGR